MHDSLPRAFMSWEIILYKATRSWVQSPNSVASFIEPVVPHVAGWHGIHSLPVVNTIETGTKDFAVNGEEVMVWTYVHHLLELLLSFSGPSLKEFGIGTQGVLMSGSSVSS